MPKQRPRDLIAPHEILSAASSRSLRPGEVQALSEYVVELEMKIDSMRGELQRFREYHERALRSDEVAVRLDGEHLTVTFPEQHSVRLPLGAVPSQHTVAFTALLRILRDRKGVRSTVGTNGAPVQYDIAQILRSIADKDITKLPAKRKSSAPEGLSIEDLDIEL